MFNLLVANLHDGNVHDLTSSLGNHSSVFITFIMICVSGSGIQVYFLPAIPTLWVSMVISTSVRFLVLLYFIHILDVSLSVSGRLFVVSRHLSSCRVTVKKRDSVVLL